MDFKNFVGTVTTVRVVKIVTPVEVMAQNQEEALVKINKRVDDDTDVRFGNRRDCCEGSRNEMVLSSKVSVEIKQAE